MDTSTFVFIAVVVGTIYHFSKKKGAMPLPSVTKQNFSYRLDIHIEPNWIDMYAKLLGKKRDDKFYHKLLEEKFKSSDPETDLMHRRYSFTEYYDSVSGLITRLQTTTLSDGKRRTFPVDEFGDRGYIFRSDLFADHSANESLEERAERDKVSVEVGDNFIRSGIYDKYIGGPKSSFDYEASDYIFRFPLSDVFNFLLALGTRFHGTEQNLIIKWPEQIEKRFKEFGIKYETQFDHEPDVFNIEKHDKEFFEQIGKPTISSSRNDSQFFNTYLTTEDNTHYSVSLKIFRPEENDRIGTFPQ